MESFLDQIGPIALGGALVLALIAFYVAVSSNLKVKALKERWSKVLEGSDSESLESLLKDHVDRVHSFSGRVDDSASRIALLESKMQCSKRFVGVIRYDAFEDMGGAQSFALAVYDDNGDGAVVTSQIGRNDCRVYAKELKGGKSERELSNEEKQAIEAAAVSNHMVGSRN